MDTELIEDPRLLGLEPESLAALVDGARRQLELGGLPSCQLAVARNGRLGLFETLGDAAPGSRYAIYSVSKALVAAAIWQLMADGSLSVGQRVAELIPEFGASGKGEVTVEQLLTHTAGLPHAILGPPEWFRRDQRLRRMAQWELAWPPGSRCEYHATSAHWVLGEIIERVAHTDYRDFIARRVSRALGLAGLELGVPVARQGDINTVSVVGSPASDTEWLQFYGDIERQPPSNDHNLLLMNQADVCLLGVPGGGAAASAADVALFYQALLHNPGRLWREDILGDATGHIRVHGADVGSGVAANRSLGLIIQGGDGQGGRRGMGTRTSARSFGHQGAGGQLAWADPVSGLSFCFLSNGLDANQVRVAQRGPALSDLAAECVRLSRGGRPQSTANGVRPSK